MEIKEKIIDYFFDLLSQPHVYVYTDDFYGAIKREFEKFGAEVHDDNGVLVAKIPASSECVNRKPIILQSHLDMEAVKNEDVIFDFFVDPLKVQLDEKLEWLSGVGTNFGAVNGMAIAYMLLLLEDENFKHPEMYFFLTSDKGFSMTALKGFNYQDYKNCNVLINLDNTKAGELVIQTPGKEIVGATYTYEKKLTLGATYQLDVFGPPKMTMNKFKAQQPGNPAKIMAHIVAHLMAIGSPVQVVDVDCQGTIFRSLDKASVKLISSMEENEIVNKVTEIVNIILPCYPDLKIRITPLKKADKLMAFNRQNSGNMMFNLLYLPESIEYASNGKPVASSDVISCTSDNDKVEIKELIKFVNPSYEGLMKSRVSLFYAYTQGYIKTEMMMFPWSDLKDSRLQKLALKTWKELTGKDMVITSGEEVLDTEYISKNLPNLEAISIGTTVEDVDTPNERVNLKTAVEVYEFLKLLIEKISEGALWNI